MVDTVTLTSHFPGEEPRTVTLTTDTFRRAALRIVDGLTGEVMEPDEPYPLPAGRAFIDPDTTAILDYIEAPDIKAIAEMLIRRHGHLAWLASVRISYLWRCKGGQAGGKATFGACQRASGLVRHFGRVALVIWLAWDHCGLVAMTRRQVEALVYHQLLHAERTEKGQAVIQPHDFEGFTRELEEYGPWQADLQRMVEAARQLELFRGDAGTDDRADEEADGDE